MRGSSSIFPLENISASIMCLNLCFCVEELCSLTPRASTRATVQHLQQFAQVARQSFTGDAAVLRVPLSSICNPDDFSTVPTVAGAHSEMVIFSSLEMITSPCHGHASFESPYVQNDLYANNFGVFGKWYYNSF